MIDIKRHGVESANVTYDVKIFTDLHKLPAKFIQCMNITKEEVIKIIEERNAQPTPMSMNIYKRLVFNKGE